MGQSHLRRQHVRHLHNLHQDDLIEGYSTHRGQYLIENIDGTQITLTDDEVPAFVRKIRNPDAVHDLGMKLTKAHGDALVIATRIFQEAGDEEACEALLAELQRRRAILAVTSRAALFAAVLAAAELRRTEGRV